MSLTRWLNGTPLAAFVAQHYLRFPHSAAGGGTADCALGSWETLGRLLGAEEVDAMVVRDGRRVEVQPPGDAQACQALAEQGCTVLVRQAQRHDPALAELAHGFARDFGGPVNIHVYATPAGKFGFGWHYDAEEVFILQTLGTKEYSLRKNTVNPWPLEETLPVDMRYEREIMPLMRCLLSPGDWLYIPCGYWHRAEAKEMSISLAVGIASPAAIEVYDFLRPRLLESLLWRQRLPVSSPDDPSEEAQEEWRRLFAELAADLQKTVTSESFRKAFLSARQARIDRE